MAALMMIQSQVLSPVDSQSGGGATVSLVWSHCVTELHKKENKCTKFWNNNRWWTRTLALSIKGVVFQPPDYSTPLAYMAILLKLSLVRGLLSWHGSWELTTWPQWQTRT